MHTTKPVTLCGSLSKFAVGMGAAMHMAGYRERGLPFTYVPFSVTDVGAALQGMRTLGIRGLGISMPFKQEALAFVDKLDAYAARLGAVNTIVNDGGILTGYNTDGPGAIRALEEVQSLSDGRVLLFGAGGAARAIAFAIRDKFLPLAITNRTHEKAVALANEVGAVALKEHELASFGATILINATSCGMKEVASSSPIRRDLMGRHQVVMDIVYKPIETELIQMAAQVGAKAIHGGRMLLHQAALQFELYTNAKAPLDAMDAALRDQLSAR